MENNSALEKANNNIITRSQWRGLNFLIAFSFFHLLCFCLYVGDWGFSKGDFCIFVMALISYFFINILPVFWLGLAYMFFMMFLFIIFKPINLEFIYILSLIINVFWFKLKKIKWFYYFLLPIGVHLMAFSLYGIIFIKPFNWDEFGLLIHNISEKSLLWELISIYPIIGLAKLFNKFVNWIRLLE